MIRLYLDTSYKKLNIGLEKENEWLEKISLEAFKKQSELTMPMIEEVFLKHHLNPSSLGEIVITSGPGSYTGIRIAMTIAKVLGAIAKVKVYTLNTLQAIIGLSDQSVMAIIDARSKRVYMAVYQFGQEQISPQVVPLDRLKYEGYVVVGDTQLIGEPQTELDLLENMKSLKNHWHLQENIHQLVPLYLKENDEYGAN